MRVQHNTQQKIAVTVHDGGSSSILRVSKGAMTVANAETGCCELCDGDTHLMLHSATPGSRMVQIVAADTRRELARLEVAGLWSTLSTQPDVRVTGIKPLAQHMIKKRLPLPRGGVDAVPVLEPHTSLPHVLQRVRDMLPGAEAEPGEFWNGSSLVPPDAEVEGAVAEARRPHAAMCATSAASQATGPTSAPCADRRQAWHQLQSEAS
jgi:hypothetical protein